MEELNAKHVKTKKELIIKHSKPNLEANRLTECTRLRKVQRTLAVNLKNNLLLT